jgi:hypothetical protein
MTSHLHVDIDFASIYSFKPSEQAATHSDTDGGGGELAVFALCGIELVHGWVAEDGKESETLRRAGTYEKAQEWVVRGMEAVAKAKSGQEVSLEECTWVAEGMSISLCRTLSEY